MPDPNLPEEAARALAKWRHEAIVRRARPNVGDIFELLPEGDQERMVKTAAIELQVALPAIEKKVRRDLQERLTGLAIGTAPDRDERYQTAWRDGVGAARDSIFEEQDDGR